MKAIYKVRHHELVPIFNIATREEFEQYANGLFKLLTPGALKVLIHGYYTLSNIQQAYKDLDGRKTSASSGSFDRLIRFQDEAGNTRFGEPKLTSGGALDETLSHGTLEATVFEGTDIFNLESSTKVVKVKQVLPLLSSRDVPIVECIGLNYIKHIQEGGRKPPPYPSVFLKPRTAVAGWNEDIPIPKIAQDDQLDYEGKLCIVIGKTGKDISESDAVQYIAGFVTCNDVSTRKWQRDPAFAGGVPQWCFSKGFDKFAPLGPMLVSPKVVGNAGNPRLQTWVNGDLRQDSSTNDMLFNTEQIVAFISQGTTLEAGTVIMTGTPAGVAMGMKEPKWLKDGDVVEVRIEELGSVKNRMSFQ